ncbi:hypothetical protein SAMN04487967_3702 [Natronorubrum sediminis]|uniref:AtuA-like ferredoxin-fold domain-containing protein n=1 Tax=Natronorubrum sediminis TaxID=640943 RepID=A0A1H6G856_9EURY|nr:hypothetical protein [Natronorubrum sediminis]SEH18164.1 hypothetical protein SAMN04487967_3702 [Natronorubrum sediminis]
MRLYDVAHGRSGDKGNKANVGIIATDGDDYPFLRDLLTETYVARVFDEFLEEPGAESVDRYVLPEMKGLNFVLHGALDGGASESLRTDRQGKTLAAMLLRQEVGDEYEQYQK